jgi:hypothetical protein
MDAQDTQVTNHNEFALKGRYAGIDYIFPPEEPVIAPFAAVQHIFGYGLDRNDRAGRAAVLNRLGVLKLGGDYNAALAVIFKVQFVTATVSFEPQVDEESGLTPARPSGSPGGETEAAGTPPASADLPKGSFDELRAKYGTPAS